MSPDFSEFDKFKKDLSKKWAYISVYDIEGIETLLLDSFKLFFYALLNKGLNVNIYLNRIFKKSKNEFLCFRITKKIDIEEGSNDTLTRFLESD